MEEIMEILKELDWSPLFISIKTGIVATVISFFLGIFAARKVVKASPGKKAVIDGILTLPMVLPPTVAGFFLLLLFSRRRPFGSFLEGAFEIKVVQSWAGCVIAAMVIAFPLMYRNARAAFEQVDPNLIYAGRTLGMSEWQIFHRVLMPGAVQGLLSGGILAFARGLGEFGATAMIAGNIEGRTRTLPLAVYSDVAAGNMESAGRYVLILVLISFIVVTGMGYATYVFQRFTRRESR